MGDLPGHPFRGNQYTHDGGEGTRGSHRDARRMLSASTDKTTQERDALDKLMHEEYFQSATGTGKAHPGLTNARNEIVRLANERVPRDLAKLSADAARAQREQNKLADPAAHAKRHELAVSTGAIHLAGTAGRDEYGRVLSTHAVVNTRTGETRGVSVSKGDYKASGTREYKNRAERAVGGTREFKNRTSRNLGGR